MTTLAKDTPRSYELGGWNDMPVIAADIIYEGALVGNNGSGYARPLVAGDPSLGFAKEHCDNSLGSAGDKRVRLQPDGWVELTVTGVDGVDDVGKAVYASDDNAFTLTAGSNSYLGYVWRHVSGTKCVVRYGDGLGGTLAELTDDSTGAASDTIASISDTATKNAVASLAAKVNALIRRGN